MDIRESEALGRAAHAVHALAPGDLVLAAPGERALLSWERRSKDAVKYRRVARGVTKDESYISAILAFVAAQQDVQEDVLNEEVFFRPTADGADEGGRALASLASMAKQAVAYPDLAAAGEERLAAFLAVVVANGHAVSADRLALFRRASKVAHSCAPNLLLVPGEAEDGTPCVNYRALRPIAEGELLTYSYLGDFDLCWPTALRRMRLRETKFFHCCCQRCAAEYDALRCVPCAVETCPGTMFYSEQAEAGETADGIARPWRCTRCETSVSTSLVDLSTRGNEGALSTRINQLASRAGVLEDDVRDILETAVTCLHEGHWVVGACHRLILSCLERARVQEGASTPGAAAVRHALWAAQTMRWHERFARDFYPVVALRMAFEAILALRATGQFKLAEDMVRTRVEPMRVAWGPDDADVAEMEAFSREFSCHGCHERSTVMNLCGGCLSARYHSRECQKAHWKQHKGDCASAKALKDAEYVGPTAEWLEQV